MRGLWSGRSGFLGGSKGFQMAVPDPPAEGEPEPPPEPPPAAPDFTVSNSTVTTDWSVVTVGTLTPTGVDPNTVYFTSSDEPAGIAVTNG